MYQCIHYDLQLAYSKMSYLRDQGRLPTELWIIQSRKSSAVFYSLYSSGLIQQKGPDKPVNTRNTLGSASHNSQLKFIWQSSLTLKEGGLVTGMGNIFIWIIFFDQQQWKYWEKKKDQIFAVFLCIEKSTRKFNF